MLLVASLSVCVLRTHAGSNLPRQKREWATPPRPLTENHDYTGEEAIAKIRSDAEYHGRITYSLEGVGTNMYPFDVFVVNRTTGAIRVTKVLDREDIDMYNLLGIAKYDNNSLAHGKIKIQIKVVDENDNAPVFGAMKPVGVYELSVPGTPVTTVTATDADEPGNKNTQLVYSIVKQEPPHGMFAMNRQGNIVVKEPSLDREREDQYFLTVKAQDLNGSPEGLTGTSTLTINVLDVNDNPPTTEKEKYEGNVEENTHGVEVMRIKAQDLDLKGTENWEAVFDIDKGNEANYFSIKTDPNTNEGILMLDQPVDYEKVKTLDLGLTVRNKATVHGKVTESTSYKRYPVKINVKNQREGPRFDPQVKGISMSEEDSNNIKKVIASYPAIDQDTGKPAEKVTYIKSSDPDNWLTIDPDTADIKLNKMPDRESPFLVNGTYFVEVLCISKDMPLSTATGTVGIQVEDFNDHFPTLTNTIETLCIPKNNFFVTAVDEDDFPNGAPFTFEIIPEGTKGKWQVEHLNDTSAFLRTQEPLWPGLHEVVLLVKDMQGEASPHPQKVTVQVCTCEDGVICGRRGAHGQPAKRAELGPAAIGLLLLGPLLFLLIPLLLLKCQCGDGVGRPRFIQDQSTVCNSHLISYCTEGKGDNTKVPLTYVPAKLFSGRWSEDVVDPMNRAVFEGRNDKQLWAMTQENKINFGSRFEGGEVGAERAAETFDCIALPDHILAQYYTQKWQHGGEKLAAADALLEHDYEGQGSSSGSLGCCSLLESSNDLQFLDDLDLKFKTLAEVCAGKKVQQVAPLPSTSPTKVVSERLPEPLKLPPVDHTVLRDKDQSNVRKSQAMSTEVERVGNQGQGVLLQQQQQQPVYYTATSPVLQPMQYVVQPQVHNTLLLAETPAANLQGMMLATPAQGVLVQGRTMVSGGLTQNPGMVLVENAEVQNAAQGVFVQGRTMVSGGLTQNPGMVLVENAEVQNAAQGMIVQGKTMVSGGLTQNPGMVLVENAKVQNAAQGVFVQGRTMVSGGLTQNPGMVLVENAKVQNAAQGVFVQGRTMVSGGLTQNPGMVLVENAKVQTIGGRSGVQSMMVVEGNVPAGSIKVPKGIQTSLQPGRISGAERILVAKGSSRGSGQTPQEAGGVSLNRKTYALPNSKAGEMVSSNKTSTYRKVAVQEKLK
ncbi:desmoglein-2.1-like isoform X3 [Nerophis ophidion]|uniref:desmoglein-2.1-like isoform X3 n=1 Tax=Nerophis ophidion TaxID=159077 RepID=UPI002ADF5AD0|nr:desmoglein-2.1-like isoform X3 [Nerophis ophidion]